MSWAGETSPCHRRPSTASPCTGAWVYSSHVLEVALPLPCLIACAVDGVPVYRYGLHLSCGTHQRKG